MSTDETEVKYELKVRQIESIEQLFADKKASLIIRGEDKKLDKLVTESEDKGERVFKLYFT